MPTSAAESVELVLKENVHGRIEIENGSEPKLLKLSLTNTWTKKVPSWLGVPVTAPAVLMLRPGGVWHPGPPQSWPDQFHEYGFVPPDAVN